MAGRHNFGITLVQLQVHVQLTGGLIRTLQHVPVKVHKQQHIRRQHPLADACRRRNDLVVSNTDGDVAVIGRHKILDVHFLTDFADYVFRFIN